VGKRDFPSIDRRVHAGSAEAPVDRKAAATVTLATTFLGRPAPMEMHQQPVVVT
jgi:hypothetical protein